MFWPIEHTFAITWFLGNVCVKPYFNTQCNPSPPSLNLELVQPFLLIFKKVHWLLFSFQCHWGQKVGTYYGKVKIFEENYILTRKKKIPQMTSFGFYDDKKSSRIFVKISILKSLGKGWPNPTINCPNPTQFHTKFQFGGGHS